MSFMYEVKYRGCIQVSHWQPSHAQPRPGLIEANACVKRIMAQEKQSITVVLSASPELGVKCVDTNFNPPKTLMSNSVYEIAHCGVDVSKPRLFTLIVGTKGDNAMFFCHVFKCDSKETSSKITRAVAQVCTQAYQEHQKKKQAGGGGGGAATTPGGSTGGSISRKPADDVVEQRRQAYRRQSMKAAAVKAKPRVVPKLTDSWFRPAISRQDVNTVLRGARVGDFVVRESQSQPGDYAVSVQTGKNIWTGLILHSADGFQLGNRGGVLFDELIDLIAYYCENKFMNDDFGYPLTLRLPPDAEANQEERRRTAEPARRPTFKNPPLFNEGDEDAGGEGYAPACGWPDSGDEEDDGGASFSFVPGKSMRAEDMSEQEAFDTFMNAGGGMDMAEMDAAMAELSGGARSGGGGGQRRGPPPAADSSDEEDEGSSAPAPQAVVAPVVNAEPALLRYAKHVFDMVPTKDDEGCVGGADIRPILMQCGLDVAVLGRIWMEVDQSRRGKIDLDQLGLILGMIGQAQQGKEPCLEALYPDSAQPPTLAGVEY